MGENQASAGGGSEPSSTPSLATASASEVPVESENAFMKVRTRS